MADDRFDQGFPPPADHANAPNPFASPTSVETLSDQYITRAAEPLNPWFSMWLKPRQTVRQQLDTDPTKYIFLLAALGGISGNLDKIAEHSVGQDLPFRVGILAGVIVGGAIGGVIWLYLAGWLAGISGRRLGGVGDAADLRTALAWSQIPTVWLLPFSLAFAAAFIFFGAEAIYGAMVADQDPAQDFSFSDLPVWMLLFAATAVVVGLWQIVITCQSVGEAHQISSGKGFLSLLIAGIMLAGLALVIVLPLVFVYFALR